MPRKATNLPKYVKLAGGRYVYRPYIPTHLRHRFDTDKYGYLRPPIGLGPPDTPLYKILAAHSKLEEQMKYEREPTFLTLNWLFTQYKKSRLFLGCEPETQNRYRDSASLLKHEIDINGQPATLGDLLIDQLSTPMIRQLLDNRLDQYQAKGKSGASQCNNEKALLSSMYRYAIQYVEEVTLPKNPCHGVDKFKVKVRERYVTDDEYALQYDYAVKSGISYLPIVMELTYLLAARGIEATNLKVGDAKTEGIEVNRKKGSRTTLVRWTPRLQTAWDAAIALLTGDMDGFLAPQQPLLKKSRGTGAISRAGLSTAWQRNLKTPMEKAGDGDVYFWLHDLKRKGISDASDDRIAGHVSDTTRSNYNRLVQEFDAPK